MPMYDSTMSLDQFALMDDRRVYIKCMMVNNVVGMFWALRDMAIILNRNDLINKLDNINKRPYFSPESLSTAYFHITTGVDEIDFRNQNDSQVIETYTPGIVLSEVRKLIEELQKLMGELLDTQIGENVSEKLIGQVSDRERENLVESKEDDFEMEI